MFKKILIVCVAVLMAVPLLVVANQSLNDADDVIDEMAQQIDYSTRYTSAQFTQPETDENQELNMQSSLEGYTKAAENEDLILYVEEDSLAIKIENKDTGYIWASGLDEPDNYRLNTTWKQIVQSAITVNYTDRQGREKSESILTNDSTPDVTITDNGFSANIFLYQSKLTLQVDVSLEGSDLVVSIPQDKIKEDKYNKLISLQLYPFFGAVNEDDIPGYMFIPDGSGALVRFEKPKKSVAPFVAPIFGRDEGILSRRATSSSTRRAIVPVEQVTMPVFGAVHGVKQNGYVAVVEDGYAYGDIVAYSSGATTDFNRVSSQFHYRYQYYQPTSKSMSGINVYQDEMNELDVQVRYSFLSNEDADYVGMAKKYRDYLVANDQLPKVAGEVDLRLEFLGGEIKEGLFWDSVIPMTEIERVPEIVDELQNNGIEDMFVVYKGWSKGGLTGTLPKKFPFERKLGSKGNVKDTIASLKEEDIPMYFYSDYTTAFEGAGGFSGSKDVAKKISSEIISYRHWGYTAYFLSPLKALEMAKKDVKEYQNYGMENLAIDSTGYTLFSDFSKEGSLTREETLNTYNDILTHLREEVGSTALYKPNVYAWKVTDKYLDVPMHSSNYVYETDTVPFLQIVLKGYIPYYAPFSNFNSNPEDQILRLIEYGAYPSFILTEESSNLLADTPSSHIYTSEFSIWKDDIISQYNKVKETLGQVESATIEGRNVPKSGIVEVSYSNGKTIIVNYTNSDYSTDGITIGSKEYAVVNRGGEQ